MSVRINCGSYYQVQWETKCGNTGPVLQKHLSRWRDKWHMEHNRAMHWDDINISSGGSHSRSQCSIKSISEMWGT